MRLKNLIATVRDAGRKAMEIYDLNIDVAYKADHSPVTEADLAVDAILTKGIADQFPACPMVTEEQADTHNLDIGSGRFFLVDPIDGTKEFIKKTGEFTINIGLIENGVPTAGIVYAPALGRLFIADTDGSCYELDENDQRKDLRVRDCTDDSALIAVASRSHNTPETQDFLDKNKISECVSAGSSLKFCVLAAGEADIYPRFGPTMEWDTAAGHAVLSGAGGQVVNIDGSPFKYGKPDFRNPNFIACSPHAFKRCLS
ncbi:3'(2'),5'-bisphosphate nucleotidase CysQ [Ahrensia sp. 13_GOM-1096m]|uniref:3'(2'),5'-bisphosphate nucleotidase CysQ n=1 Tax=Ahrensia sp. 13_GOM-1096m TaxID=1380380 RepID=UPI00047E3E2F|nr:3'(2'),5'-bisphosphate nucleotidase CysQ [Ahrensia sp. 13_GOM-1096m]